MCVCVCVLVCFVYVLCVCLSVFVGLFQKFDIAKFIINILIKLIVKFLHRGSKFTWFKSLK